MNSLPLSSAPGYSTLATEPLEEGTLVEGAPHRTRGPCGTGTCCQADRSAMQTTWSFVGEGRGAYQQVESFNYIGEGCGSFDKEVVTSHSTSMLRKCCFGMLCCSALAMALASFAYLTIKRETANAQSTDSSYQVVVRNPDLGQQEAAVASANKSYDCVAGYSNWHTGWSLDKKEWCCQHKSRGCPEGQPAPYDCLTSDSQSWAEQKKEWCCQHHHRGCSSAMGDTFDCNAGWKPGWSPSKMTWCCQHKQIGCDLGCNAPCAVKGKTATCDQRITWTAENIYAGQPNACELAHDLVLEECQECSMCFLDASTCGDSTPQVLLPGTFDCDAGFNNWKAGWSAEQKAWCCKHVQRGCMATTTNFYPPDLYDCSADQASWNTWSPSKKVWCCQEFARGCEATSSAATTATSAPPPVAGNVTWSTSAPVLSTTPLSPAAPGNTTTAPALSTTPAPPAAPGSTTMLAQSTTLPPALSANSTTEALVLPTTTDTDAAAPGQAPSNTSTTPTQAFVNTTTLSAAPPYSTAQITQVPITTAPMMKSTSLTVHAPDNATTLLPMQPPNSTAALPSSTMAAPTLTNTTLPSSQATSSIAETLVFRSTGSSTVPPSTATPSLTAQM